jgi:hypothetical protein
MPCDSSLVKSLSESASPLERGEISALVGLWWVHLLMFGCIFLLYAYRYEKLPNSEQCYKGKVKTHNYINRQNQSTSRVQQGLHYS